MKKQLQTQPTVKTPRLTIYPLSDPEMQTLIQTEQDPEMKQAYTEMYEGCKQNPDKRIWNAVWNMQLNEDMKTIVGDLSFKGLSSDGSVEIGYGIKKEFEGQGYMTEAVTAMAKWASEQDGVKHVEAETEVENKASKRVLEKAGFHPNGVMGAEGPRFEWKK
ncbi:MAG: GNAT family N-acetyltransferase [bacterium]|nr:GNAT family N-acetyltransferase [bacterium]